jgi:signal peptidase I
MSLGSKPRPTVTGQTAAQGEAVADASARKKKRSALGIVIEVLVIIVAAFVIAMLVQAFLVKPFTIHQVSMLPTLEEGDRILINRLTYHFREPRAGDIIVFQSPLNSHEDLVKRIVAVAGDRVSIEQGVLYVNGEPVEEPYLLERPFAGAFPETEVPPGHVFVLGDNRNNSGDSRLFGPVDEKAIIGTAFLIYWPIGHWGTL